ncbi:MAG: hypothetical protein LBT24_05205 [Tannerella sp.]|nr:hypothetical protein [Tannerella sp.]
MRKILILGVLLFFISSIYAQVGINTESPNVLTTLDVQNAVNSKGDTIFRGIMIPRMTEAQRNAINVSNDSIAESLLIYNIDESCYNYFMKSEGEWRSLCGAPGKAVFTIDCGSISAIGQYIESIDMNVMNYLRLTMDVKKSGTYTIFATSSPSNGYSFVSSGIFTNTGLQTITIPAQGMPKQSRTDVFTVVGGTLDCSAHIDVKPNIADFSIDCSNTVVNGIYVKGTQLTAANTISIRVRINGSGYFEISTPKINGISFSAKGVWSSGTSGTQTVILEGSGIPTTNLDFSVAINSNSQSGNTSCSATIQMTLPAMTYAIIGDDVWSWQNPVRREAFNSTSFGPYGKVKIQNLEQLWLSTNIVEATTRLNSGYTGNGYTNARPDIVLFYAYGSTFGSNTTNTANLSAALANYVNHGGCLMYAPRSGEAANAPWTNPLLSAMFGSSYAKAQRQAPGTHDSTDDAPYMINNLPSDPVINGPFGNLAGKHWGEDNATVETIILTELPPNSIQVCSAYNATGHDDVNPDYSTVWYNSSKHFFYFGDSTGASSTQMSDQSYPTIYIYGVPYNKAYGNVYMSPNRVVPYCYNAALELNALSWLIYKAAANGINPH